MAGGSSWRAVWNPVNVKPVVRGQRSVCHDCLPRLNRWPPDLFMQHRLRPVVPSGRLLCLKTGRQNPPRWLSVLNSFPMNYNSVSESICCVDVLGGFYFDSVPKSIWQNAIYTLSHWILGAFPLGIQAFQHLKDISFDGHDAENSSLLCFFPVFKKCFQSLRLLGSV